LKKAEKQRVNKNWPKYTQLKTTIMTVVYEIQEGKCLYCQVEMTTEDGPNRITREHRIPKSRGTFWTDDPALSCYLCNSTKKDMSEEEFLLSQEFCDIIEKRFFGGETQCL
jgi:hypothetical protein